jgi:hypothetical protein
MKRKATPNSTYPKVAVQWLNQALCLTESEVFQTLRSGQVRNRQLQQHAKRYVSF